MVLETKSSVEKKTALHDLYEKEGQSPWYDNLSRPVADLKSLIDSGVRGVTSNPTVCTAVRYFFFLECERLLIDPFPSHSKVSPIGHVLKSDHWWYRFLKRRSRLLICTTTNSGQRSFVLLSCLISAH